MAFPGLLAEIEIQNKERESGDATSAQLKTSSTSVCLIGVLVGCQYQLLSFRVQYFLTKLYSLILRTATMLYNR